VAAGGQDGRVRLWDIAEPGNDPLQSFDDHKLPVTAIAFSPDGQLLASAEGELNKPSIVIVRDVLTGQPRYHLQGFGSTVRALTFSPDGSVLLTGDGNAPTFGEVIYWEAATGRRLRIVPGDVNEIHGLTFSPNGSTLAISGGWADQMGRLRLWDAETGAVIHNFTGFGQRVAQAAFTPDGKQIVAGSGHFFAGGEIKSWQTVDGTARFSVPAHIGPVRTVAVSPDGGRLASVGQDQLIKIWDLEGGELLLTLPGHKYPISTASFSSDGTKLITAGGPVTGDAPAEILVWDAAPTADRIALRTEFGAQLKAVATTGDERPQLFGLQTNNIVKAWDVTSGRSIQINWSVPGELVQSIAVTADGTQLVTGGSDALHWWNPQTSELVHSTPFDGFNVAKADFSNDGKALAVVIRTTYGMQTIQIYDSETKQPRTKVDADFQIINAMKWSPDGNLLAIAGQASFDDYVGKLRIVNARDGKLVRELQVHQQPISDIQFSPDSKRLAVAETVNLYAKSRVRPISYVVNVESGTLVSQYDGHSMGQVRVGFSSDGQTLLTVGLSGGVKFWTTETGELQRTIDLDITPTNGAWLTNDNQILVVAPSASAFELWDLQTGKPRERILNWPRAWKGGEQDGIAGVDTLAQRVSRLAPPPKSENSVAETVRYAARADRRMQTADRLKELALAFHNYHAAFQNLPTSAIMSNDGTPLLSWRVSFLPWLGANDLYEQFHLDEPWDSPHNKLLLDKIPEVFAPPLPSVTELGPHRRENVTDEGKASKALSEGLTHIRLITGPSTLFPGAANKVSFDSITDGKANTILVLEHSDAVPWTKPDELTLDDGTDAAIPKLVGSVEPNGLYISFADGSVRFIDTSTLTPQQVRALITRDGGEAIP
jgi:WD40 repeat protein